MHLRMLECWITEMESGATLNLEKGVSPTRMHLLLSFNRAPGEWLNPDININVILTIKQYLDKKIENWNENLLKKEESSDSIQSLYLYPPGLRVILHEGGTV